MNYDTWVESKVKQALECKEPLVPHDVAMQRIKEVLNRK